MDANGDITELLPAWGKGGEAEEALFDRVEPALRRLARSALRRLPGLEHKIQPDELVNEAYVRLKQYLGTRENVSFENRRPFFALVLKVMRQILLDVAKKGGASAPRTTLMLTLSAAEASPDQRQSIDVYAFYQTLDRLRAKDEKQADAIEWHYIGGWTLDESAELMGLSTATLKRRLVAARQWFEMQLAASS